MKDCIYYLNIGNRNVVLIGDEELNKFISENIVSNRKLSIEEELTPNRVFGVFKNNEETLVINNNLPGGKIQEDEDPREFLEKKFINFENLQISDILASNLINDEKVVWYEVSGIPYGKQTYSNNILGESVKYALKSSKSVTMNDAQEKSIEALRKAVPFNKDINTPYTFLATKQNIDGQFKYLTPEFIEENYKTNLALKLKAEGKTEEEINLEIKRLLEKNAFTEKISEILGGIVRRRINFYLFGKNLKYNTIENDLEEVVNAILKYNNDTSTSSNEQIKKNIIAQIDGFIAQFLSTSSEVLTNVNISVGNSINPNVKMSGIAHAISIDTFGNPNIYEIKVSSNTYSEWDQSKKDHTDYLLGIKRQLLSNYLDTSKTSLNIINIIIPYDNDTNTFNLNGITVANDIERTSYKSNSSISEKLNYNNGEITTLLRRLLPANTVKSKEVASSMLKNANDLIQDILPSSYKVRTRKSLEVEEFYNNLLKRYSDDSEVVFRDLLKTHDNKLVFKKSDPNWEKNLRLAVEEYVERYNLARFDRVNKLVEKIKKDKANKNKIWTTVPNDNGVLEQTFTKYLGDEWELLNNAYEELNSLEVLVFKNTITNVIEIISLTSNDFKQTYPQIGTTILGKYKPDSEIRSKKILEASTLNLELIRAMAIINSFTPAFGDIKLGTVQVVSMGIQGNQLRYILNQDLLTENFTEVIKTVNSKSGNTYENNFKNKIVFQDKFEAIYDKLLGNAFELKQLKHGSSSSHSLHTILQTSNVGIASLKDANAKLKWLLNLREAIWNSELINKNVLKDKEMGKINIDLENPIEYVYALVSEGIAYYKGLLDVFEFGGSGFGVKGGDFLHFIKIVAFGESEEYDSKGRKITGALQGSYFSTTDEGQSETFQKLHDVITIARNKIVTMFNEEHVAVGKASKKFYEEMKRSKLQWFIIGGADSFHKNMYELDGEKITKEFKFKNPWDPKATLRDAERDYLKSMLFLLFKNSNLNKFGIKNIEEFEKSVIFNEKIKLGDSTLFLAPLMKKTGMERWMPTTGEIHKFINRIKDDFTDNLDPKNRTEEERDKMYYNINGFREIHNQYDLGNDTTFRNELLENYGVEHFEINIDTIVTKYVLEHIREEVFGKIMLDIHGAITLIKIYGKNSGNTEETEKALQDFWDQLKVGVENIALDHGEWETVLLLTKKLQRITSLMSIALRPVLMAKELTVGFFKNVAFSYYKIYSNDSFGEQDLFNGYKSVLDVTDETFILNDSINDEYSIANSDISQMANKKKFDRRGINYLSEYLYWFNTAPDYVNRLALFFAKMHRDGTYFAHKVVDGKLTYDARLDERFKYYLETRNKYKINGEYTYPKNDSKFTEQRTLYLAHMEVFNKERLVVGDSQLTEEDMLPRAYTVLEKESIKTFVDTAYGYYDLSRTPLWFNQMSGILFGQFLKYYPGKVKYYFGKPTKNKNRGYFGQLYEEEDGKKHMLWKKKNEKGVEVPVREEELTSEDARIPAKGWNGEIFEGLMYSLALTARDVAKGNLEKTDKLRVQRAKLALNDLAAALAMLLVGWIFLSDKKAIKEMGYAEKTMLLVGMKSMSDLNMIASVFGSLQATPAFIEIAGSTWGDFKQVMTGDLEVMKMLRQNIRMLELLPSTLNK